MMGSYDHLILLFDELSSSTMQTFFSISCGFSKTFAKYRLERTPPPHPRSQAPGGKIQDPPLRETSPRLVSLYLHNNLNKRGLLCFTEDGEDDRLSDILESLPVNFGLKDFDRLLPSRFPQLEYRPLLIIAVDSDREQMAIRLIELGASFHVAGRVSSFSF